MTGSPCSSSSTNGRHPNLIQQQSCRDSRVSDKLRRMAIKNSYESRSLCGTNGIQAESALAESISPSSTGKLLPSLTTKQPPNSQKHPGRSKRPVLKVSPPRAVSSTAMPGSNRVSPSAVHDVGASAGDDPDVVDETKKSSLQVPADSSIPSAHDHLRRSTSHSSVALNGTSSLSQPTGDTSSYIYHVPDRLISRGRSRSQSRVHAHMRTHNIPTSTLKRSSSYSTVALNRTGHYPSPPALVPSPPSTTAAPLNCVNCPACPQPPYSHQHNHHHHCGGSQGRSHHQLDRMLTQPSTTYSRQNKVW